MLSLDTIGQFLGLVVAIGAAITTLLDTKKKLSSGIEEIPNYELPLFLRIMFAIFTLFACLLVINIQIFSPNVFSISSYILAAALLLGSYVVSDTRSYLTLTTCISMGAAITIALAPNEALEAALVRESSTSSFIFMLIAISVANILAARCLFIYDKNSRAFHNEPIFWITSVAVVALTYCASIATVHSIKVDERSPISSEALPVQWPTNIDHAAAAYRYANEFHQVLNYEQATVTIELERALGQYRRRQTEDELRETVGDVEFTSHPDDYLPQTFALFGTERQEKFLNDRLRWLYPEVEFSASQVSAPLPAITANDRFQVMSDARIAAAIVANPGDREQFFNRYRYSSTIRQLAGDERTTQDFLDTALARILGQEEGGIAGKIFPAYRAIPFYDFDTNLQVQLAVGFRIEMWAAYNQYFAFAVRSAEEKLDEEAKQLIPDFLTLPRDVRRAFQVLVFNREDYFEVIEILSRLKDIPAENRDIFSLLRVSEISAISTFLRNNCRSSDLRDVNDEFIERISTEASAEIAKATSDDESAQADRDRSSISRVLSISRRDYSIAAAHVVCTILEANADRNLFGEILSAGSQNSWPVALFDREASSFANEFRVSVDPATSPLNDVFTDSMVYSLLILAEQRAAEVRVFLERFVELSSPERERMLLFFAQNHFSASGPHSLSIFANIIAGAEIESKNIAVGIGLIFWTIVAVSIGGVLTLVIGSLISRFERNVEKAIENGRPQNEIDGIIRLDRHQLIGRQNTRDQMMQIAQSQRGTVGLTGPRGSGKSKLLRSVYQQEGESGALSVWFDCPARYEQKEFIGALYGRVLASVDEHFSKLLGRLSRAQAHFARAALKDSILFIIPVAILIVVSSVALVNLGELASSIWVPPILLLVLMLAHYSFHFFELFNRNSDADPEMISIGKFALERVGEELDYLREFLSSGRVRPGRARRFDTFSVILLVLVFLGSLWLFATSIEVFPISQRDTGSGLNSAIIVSFVFLAVVVYWLSRRYIGEEAGNLDQTTIGAIVRYRVFLAEVSEMLRETSNSANVGDHQRGVAIFVDELDKIVNMDEAKSVLREIKPLMDVEGCRYYLSVAEDVAFNLYFRDVTARDEVDSVIDYVERLRNLSTEDCITLIHTYCEEKHLGRLGDGITNTISEISQGNPRDVLRLVDWVALTDATSKDILLEEARRKLGSITSDTTEYTAKVKRVLRFLDEIEEGKESPNVDLKKLTEKDELLLSWFRKWESIVRHSLVK